MIGRSLGRQKRGKPVSAKLLNTASTLAENLSRARFGVGMHQRSVGGIPMFAPKHDDYGKVAKSGAGGIPAMSGTTPGSGTVTLYEFDGTTAYAGPAATETAYNISSNAVGANKMLILLYINGRPFVIVESC